MPSVLSPTAALIPALQKNPKSVVLLRATFKKLTSILDVPLQRIVMVRVYVHTQRLRELSVKRRQCTEQQSISQAHSEDVGSVAKHYSSELVAFVRRVLEVCVDVSDGLSPNFQCIPVTESCAMHCCLLVQAPVKPALTSAHEFAVDTRPHYPQVIPQNVFRILAKLIDLQATQMKTIPTKMEVISVRARAMALGFIS